MAMGDSGALSIRSMLSLVANLQVQRSLYAAQPGEIVGQLAVWVQHASI